MKFFIDCTYFSYNKKRIVQDALFELGFDWGFWKGRNYHNLDADYYTNVGSGKSTKKILAVGYNSEVHEYHEITFDELMTLAGNPCRDGGEPRIYDLSGCLERLEIPYFSIKTDGLKPYELRNVELRLNELGYVNIICDGYGYYTNIDIDGEILGYVMSKDVAPSAGAMTYEQLVNPKYELRKSLTELWSALKRSVKSYVR